MTTSRGSRVGSSAKRWVIASRTTSAWRVRPWQAWTCSEVSRSSCGVASHAVGREVVADRGLDAVQQRDPCG